MFKHDDIWRAIDRLAAVNGLSASGLARKAGLDPTTFNPSKRRSDDGKLRWPSTESVAKVLEATGTSLGALADLIDEHPPRTGRQKLPVIAWNRVNDSETFDQTGRPKGSDWDDLLFPDITNPTAFALEVEGNAFAPIYRDGDRLIVAPGADIRRGDRVVIKPRTGALLVQQLLRETATRLEFRALSPSNPDHTLAKGDVVWIARIIWASQ